MNQHTFVVCAYKESPFLEACVQSLRGQSQPGAILISTATPNDHISEIARRYGLEVRVNTGAHGIAEDWNFALRQAETPYVTLAHQDDVYEPEYAAKMLAAIAGAKNPILAFSDYFEVRGEGRVYADASPLLSVKEKLLLPLRTCVGQRSVWLRRRSLSLGNAICCPAVTYVMERMPAVPFEPGFASNVDWQTWEKLSREKGSFVYLHQPLMGHRVHEGSTTSAVIGDGDGRSREDLAMFEKFWPAPIARLLMKRYAKSQENNRS